VIQLGNIIAERADVQIVKNPIVLVRIGAMKTYPL